MYRRKEEKPGSPNGFYHDVLEEKVATDHTIIRQHSNSHHVIVCAPQPTLPERDIQPKYPNQHVQMRTSCLFLQPADFAPPQKQPPTPKVPNQPRTAIQEVSDYPDEDSVIGLLRGGAPDSVDVTPAKQASDKPGYSHPQDHLNSYHPQFQQNYSQVYAQGYHTSNLDLISLWDQTKRTPLLACLLVFACIVLLIAGGSAGIVAFSHRHAVCDVPLQYVVGSVSVCMICCAVFLSIYMCDPLASINAKTYSVLFWVLYGISVPMLWLGFIFAQIADRCDTSLVEAVKQVYSPLLFLPWLIMVSIIIVLPFGMYRSVLHVYNRFCSKQQVVDDETNYKTSTKA